jgi:tetratricopeptide (TPR) repeat protein
LSLDFHQNAIVVGMTQETPFQKELNDILKTQSFEKLHAYSDQKVWKTLSDDERTLLARLFVLAAESELKLPKTDDPNGHAKRSFASAVSLVPNDYQIWFRRAMAFSASEDKNLLEESSLCFEKSCSLCDTFLDSWYAWGSVLVRRGILSEEPSYFYSAVAKFKKAQELLDLSITEQKTATSNNADFYWHFGFLYFLIARNSEEASDLHTSIQYYRKARSLGLEHKELYNDLGNALVELALLINKPEMIFEAIELYLISLDNEKEDEVLPHELAGRYFNLGTCYQYLFEIHQEETLFKQAEDCFGEAVRLHSVFFPCWMHWGNLLLQASKLWQDAEYLERAIEKFAEASQITADAPLLLIRWSQALAHLGFHEENYSLLSESERLALKAVEVAPHLAESWYTLGLSLYSFGRYFGEEKYYIDALEKLEYGLSVEQNDGTLWHLLAIVKFTIGELQGDMRLLEEAILCFNLASKEEPARFGYFWNDWGIALLNIADITHDTKFVQEAVEKFEQAIICHEHTHVQWVINLGSALDFLGDLTDDEVSYEKAIQVLTSTLNLDPDSTLARYHLAQAYSHYGELQGDLQSFQKAVEELQKVIELDPEEENAYNDLGVCYIHIALLPKEELDDQIKEPLYELAELNLMQAISLGNQGSYYNLACLYALQGNFPDAIHYLKRALEIDLLPAPEDIMEDTWLESIKNTSQFQEFIQNCIKKAAEEEAVE